ncbi:MAG TPA: MarR family EPS-associated transcriptional regulator [Thermoanaerobaculia bacterium]|nr:MarR family EPS-associated transcriptional regulator [Thermoanaerobaculia bacterium]
MTDEVRYRLLRYLEQHPEASQRELAQHLGVSVGKINYCVKALIAKGLVKMRNFRGSRKKLTYAYILTPKGIEEKINVTYRFLRRKMEEYDSVSAEIERLNRELDESGDARATDLGSR